MKAAKVTKYIGYLGRCTEMELSHSKEIMVWDRKTEDADEQFEAIHRSRQCQAACKSY